MLRAALRKLASQNSLATAAVLQVGTRAGGFSWRGRVQGAGQADAVGDFVLFCRSMGLNQAAVELQVNFVVLL